MFTITNQFQTIFVGGEGGNMLVQVTAKSKEENSSLIRFYPNYVKEFGLPLAIYNFYENLPKYSQLYV
jgi:hypothetical protein